MLNRGLIGRLLILLIVLAGCCLLVWDSDSTVVAQIPESATLSTTALSWAIQPDDPDIAIVNMITIEQGYLAAGRGSDFSFLMLLDELANPLWTKSYSGIQINHIARHQDGSIYAIGRAFIGCSCYFVAAFDNDGDLLWHLSYRETGGPSPTDIHLGQNIIYVTVVNEFYIGTTLSRLYAFDYDGNKLWAKDLGGGPANGTLLPNDRFLHLYGAFATTLNSNGVILEKKQLTQHDVFGSGVISTDDGGYIVSGTLDWGGGSTACWAMEVNNNGQVAWERVYDNPQVYRERGSSILLARDYGYFLNCRLVNPEAHPVESYSLRIDGAGEIIQKRAYSSGDAYWLYPLTIAADNGQINLVSVVNEGLPNEQFYTKLMADGDQVGCDSHLIDEPSFNVTSLTPSAVSIPFEQPEELDDVPEIATVLPVTHTITFSYYCEPPLLPNQAFLPQIATHHSLLNLPLSEAGSQTQFSDLTSFGHNGSCLGTSCPTSTSGPNGSARQFDGNNDFITLGNPDTLQLIGNEITISAWIRPTSSNGLQNIVAQGHTESPRGELFMRINNGNYEVGSWNGTGFSTSYSIPSGDINQWVHIAGVYNGFEWQLYRNGTLVSSTPATVGAFPVYADWAIGSRGGGNERFFSGGIANIHIYARGLSQSEIGADMNN